MKVIALAGILVGALVSAPTVCAANDVAGRASVIDGDTIEIRGIRIRLEGIDAPESAQWCMDGAGRDYRCGRRAAFHLDDMLRGKVVTCHQKTTDRYGRAISECFFEKSGFGTVNINATMVVDGHALAYRRYSRAYISQEDKARRLKRGMWQGSFTPPWDWRKQNR